MTERTLLPLLNHPSVEAISFAAPTLPYATPIGTPAVSANLLILGKLAIVKKP